MATVIGTARKKAVFRVDNPGIRLFTNNNVRALPFSTYWKTHLLCPDVRFSCPDIATALQKHCNIPYQAAAIQSSQTSLPLLPQGNGARAVYYEINCFQHRSFIFAQSAF